jgi:hypothetical protein
LPGRQQLVQTLEQKGAVTPAAGEQETRVSEQRPGSEQAE